MRVAFPATIVLGTALGFVLVAVIYLASADPCMDLDTLLPDCVPERAR
ncbi:MAG: hypothetical protein WBA67_15180 [Jannaschia sp.]